MKKVQVELTTSVFNDHAFGLTKSGEVVYIPLKAATTVKKIGSRPILNKDRMDAPKYSLRKGEKIFAHLVPGLKERLIAELWAPVSVCKGEKPKIYQKGVKKQKKKILTSEESSFEPAKGLSIFIGQLRDMDQHKFIRARAHDDRRQIFYGPIKTLISTKSNAAQLAFSHSENIFEICEEGIEDEVVWPFDYKAVA